VNTLNAIELGSIIFIVLWNAFFVAAEYAFVTVRRTRLEELIAQGSRRAKAVMRIVDDLPSFISAIQLAITLSSLALGAVGEPAFSRVVEDLLGLTGASRTGVAATISVILAFAVISTLHTVLGEIVPKTFTLQNAERVALVAAAPVRAFYNCFRPFIWFLDWLAVATARILGLPEPRLNSLAHSEEELKRLVAASKDEGKIEAEEQEMVNKVFQFSDTQVDEVMVPRPDVVGLPVELTPKEAMEEVLRHPYTRYPVYRENLDDILGLLHIRRLYDALHNGGRDLETIESLLRPAYIVPETKPLAKLLGEMRRTNTHMAIVVDEYGSTAGIVTLEDLLEEIVGEIDDEFDRPDISILRLSKDRVRVAGSFPIDEFNERFGCNLSDEDYNTVGGYVFGELGRAPQEGDRVEINGLRFTVHGVDGARIVSVDVEIRPKSAGGESQGQARVQDADDAEDGAGSRT
jgi:CBS domain containing-hemolysin-like protein